MRTVIALCSLTVCGMFEARAASEAEARKAIVGMLAQPNFSWEWESAWTTWRDDPPAKGSSDFMSVTKGKSEKNGFTVATMKITTPGYLARHLGPYHTVKGAFGRQKAVVDFGRGWMAAEDFPATFWAAHGFSNKDEGEGIMSVMLWAGTFLLSGEAMPTDLLRTLLDECTGGIAVGST